MPNPDGSYDAFDGTVISQGLRPNDEKDMSDRLVQPLPQDPMIGRSLDGGKYRIVSLLGRGGMSIVYKAEQELVGRYVAIKTLTVQLLGDATIVRRFTREVHALGKLNHPNIVTAFDCVVDAQGQPYFIMDFLDGVSLAEIFDEQKRLEPERVRNIFRQVCSAVACAHDNQIVHRDLKPGNIMLIHVGAPEEQVKIVDFGLAKISEDAHKLTASGEVWGTPSYMSPEQAHGQLNDHRSDIYSVGCVMFEALTGRPPFKGNSPLDTLMMQINNVVPTFEEVAPELNIHPALEYIVQKALAKDPTERFQSMHEMEKALAELNLHVTVKNEPIGATGGKPQAAPSVRMQAPADWPAAQSNAPAPAPAASGSPSRQSASPGNRPAASPNAVSRRKVDPEKRRSNAIIGVLLIALTASICIGVLVVFVMTVHKNSHQELQTPHYNESLKQDQQQPVEHQAESAAEAPAKPTAPVAPVQQPETTQTQPATPVEVPAKPATPVKLEPEHARSDVAVAHPKTKPQAPKVHPHQKRTAKRSGGTDSSAPIDDYGWLQKGINDAGIGRD